MVYAFMLWRRGMKQESNSDKLLGSFLLLAALYVIPWMTGFAGWYDSEKPFYREFLFYTPFVHGLLMGPLLYLYVKTITNFRYQLQKKDWIHFLPGLLFIAWSIMVVIVDKLIVKRYYLMNGVTDPDFDNWYHWLQNISILFYLVLSIHYYMQYKRYVNYEMSFKDAASIGWLRNFLIAFGIITILPLIQFLLSFIPFFQNMDYIGSWYYFLSFALVVYYIAINGFNAVSIPLKKLLFQPELLLQYQQPALLPAPSAFNTKDTEYELVKDELKEDFYLKQWKEKITAAMQHEKLYEDAELTLSQLAKKFSSNPSVLSKVINQGFQLNFNDFVNSYRVTAVIDLLKAGEQKNQTLLGIAFDCGFNSKATFNRAFKKQMGMSPKDWLVQNK
jgi:AraC-like DNA-binding protein